MKMNEIGYEGPPPIDSYGGGGFRLSEVFHKGGLLLTPDGVQPWSEELSEAGFAVPLAMAQEMQQLTKLVKTEHGLEYQELSEVRFVPLLPDVAKDLEG